MLYAEVMTKAEIIARYGQEYYDACQARQKAKLKAKYAAMSAEERTVEYLARKDYVEKWHSDHPEQSASIHRKAALAAYYRMTPEERLEVSGKRRAARRAKLASDAEFAADQGAKELARLHTWRVNHRARVSDYNKPRRALGKMNGEFVRFLRSQPCIDCGTTEKPITIGHLIPVKRGGTNHPCNLVAQCRSCNGKQHAKGHPKFAQVNYPEAARYAVAA